MCEIGVSYLELLRFALLLNVHRCAVCLGEYEDRDSLRILPHCGHAFHVNCIDAWLRQQSTCPVCRKHLQGFPTRRHMPSSLISEAARSRFSPGAIPESLFERPLLDPSTPVSPSSNLCQRAHGELEQAGHMHEAKQVLVGAMPISTQNLGPEDIKEGSESYIKDYTWGFRQKNPGEYSIQQSKSWEEGDLNMPSSIHRADREGFEGSCSEVDMCNNVINVETVPPAGMVLSCQSAENLRRGLMMPAEADAGGTVQIQVQRVNPFDREAANSDSGNKARESRDTPVVGHWIDDATEGRSSFSSWVRKPHEGSKSEYSQEQAGLYCKDMDIDRRL